MTAPPPAPTLPGQGRGSIGAPRSAKDAAAWTGVAFIALSSTFYGLVPIFARAYYEAGGTPVAVLAFRYAAGALLLATLLSLAGRKLRVDAAGLTTGLLLAVISYGYLAAVRFIPVSVAALVFFTYPVVTVLTSRLLGLERIGWRRMLGVLAMFVGLALGLNVAPGVELDWRGIALSATGALAYNALLFLSHRAASTGGGIELIFQANLVCALVFLPLAWIAGDIAAPASLGGWVGLVGVAATFLAGLLAFIAGVGRSGAVRTAAFTIIEPLVAILGAVVFLGESLSLVQVLGIALTAAGIYAMGR